MKTDGIQSQLLVTEAAPESNEEKCSHTLISFS